MARDKVTEGSLDKKEGIIKVIEKMTRHQAS